MIVHRLLDAFFRGLDAVDAARDRVDQLLGREPRPDPWAVDWPPPEAGAPADAPAAPPESPPSPAAPPPEAKKPEAKKPAKKKPAAKKPVADAADPDGAKKKAGRKKKSSSSKRKGSVDRSGKDISTPRAKRVAAHVKAEQLRLVTVDDETEGKKVLARVVWALAAARGAGEAEGMTTKDVSALLSDAADIEVFTTNIGRACRDHTDLIEAAAPEGRSKRYRLTDQGAEAAKPLIQ